MSIKIYTIPACAYSRLAKNFLDTHKVEYEEMNVSLSESHYNEMTQKSHQSGVPVIEIDNHVLVGFDRKKLTDVLIKKNFLSKKKLSKGRIKDI